jgi:ATP-binding cassette subfamily C protein
MAARIAPFAFTFHRTFERRPISTRDVVSLALGRDFADLGVVVLLGLLAALIALLTPIATARLIDVVIPSRASGTIAQIVAGLALAGLSLVALEVLRSIAELRLEGRTGIATQAAVLDRLIGAPSRFFRGFSSGDLALRLGAVNAVQRAITAAAAGLIVAGLFVAANLALMLAYSVPLALVSLAVVAAAVALSVGIGLARLKLGRRIEALDGRLGGLSFELLAGIAKLRAAAAEGRAFARWSALYVERRRLNRASVDLSNFETVVMAFLHPAATALVLFLAWKMATSAEGVAARGAITPGFFVAFHAALFAALGGIQAIVGIALGLLDLKPQWERAKPLLDTVPENGPERVGKHEPLGAISLRGVEFAYPGGPRVLHGIDLEIAPGELVAIVGPSGSGKSTLIRLLLGFETPAAGHIAYDGQDLARLDLAHLRRRIGTVLQGGQLWAGDLYTNIVGASQANVEAAWEAARAAGLGEDIEAMPMGMYTVVGEGLSTLSGGQRQRVLIARALLGKPSILLLDEATSALDNRSQAAVLETIGKLDATRVVIAHRLSTVRGADRIVVMEKGRVVQHGTFATLANEPGLFRSMLERQMGSG